MASLANPFAPLVFGTPYREVYTAIHVSLAKGLAAVNSWDTPEQFTEHFEFPILSRGRQRELIRFSRSKNPRAFYKQAI
jgi:hypothetical protein